MTIEVSPREAAAICEALKESKYVFTNRYWVVTITGKIYDAIKRANKAESTRRVAKNEDDAA